MAGDSNEYVYVVTGGEGGRVEVENGEGGEDEDEDETNGGCAPTTPPIMLGVFERVGALTNILP